MPVAVAADAAFVHAMTRALYGVFTPCLSLSVWIFVSISCFSIALAYKGIRIDIRNGVGPSKLLAALRLLPRWRPAISRAADGSARSASASLLADAAEDVNNPGAQTGDGPRRKRSGSNGDTVIGMRLIEGSLKLQAEALLQRLQFVVFLMLAWAASSLTDAVPCVLMLAFPVLVVRAKLVEAELRNCSLMYLLTSEPLRFISGACIYMAAGLNGVAIVNMALRETPEVKARLLLQWKLNEIAAVLAPPVKTWGLAGLFLMVVGTSNFWQMCYLLMPTTWDGREGAVLAFRAKLAGFGGVVGASKFKLERDYVVAADWVLFFLQTICETIPAAFFISSSLIATGAGWLGDPVGAICMANTMWILSSTVYKHLTIFAQDFRQESGWQGARGLAHHFLVAFQVLFVGYAVMILIVTLQRVIGLELCSSGSWGATLGHCMPTCNSTSADAGPATDPSVACLPPIGVGT